MSLSRIDSRLRIPSTLLPNVIQFVSNQDLITLFSVNKFFYEGIENYFSNISIKKPIDHLGFLFARCVHLSEDHLREANLKKDSKEKVDQIYTKRAKEIKNITFALFISGHCSKDGLGKNGEEIHFFKLIKEIEIHKQ